MSRTKDAMSELWDDNAEGLEPSPVETEPCYGRCAQCGTDGEVWYVNRAWACYRHRRDA